MSDESWESTPNSMLMILLIAPVICIYGMQRRTLWHYQELSKLLVEPLIPEIHASNACHLKHTKERRKKQDKYCLRIPSNASNGKSWNRTGDETHAHCLMV